MYYYNYAGLQKDPLEYITMNTINKDSMMYGFQLLEKIHQVRMICEEQQDKFERQFTKDLETWTKYSLQTEQMFSRPDYKQYITEDKESIDNNMQSALADMYNARNHHLKKIQLQCDENLENLLKEHELSMIKLIADLMEHNNEILNQLIDELMSYVNQLQDGLQDCVATLTQFYNFHVASKLYEPNDFCYGPDINVLTIFLHRIQAIIWIEQSSFFGDDEDLVERPCGTSACGETNAQNLESEDFYTDQALLYHTTSFSSPATSHKFPTTSPSGNSEPSTIVTEQSGTSTDNKPPSETPVTTSIPKQGSKPPTTALKSTPTATSTILKFNTDRRFFATAPHLKTSTEQGIKSPTTTSKCNF